MANILLIIPEQSGTIARISFNIYNSLKRLNNNNVYVAKLHDSGSVGFDFGSTYDFKESKTTNRFKPFTFVKKIIFLRRIKKHLNIDITISTVLSANVYNVLSRGNNERTIGIFHANLSQIRGVSSILYIVSRLSYKFICSKLDKAVAISKKTEKDMKAHSLRNVQLIYNIHDFTNIKKMAGEEFDPEEGKIFDRPVLLFVGYLYGIKGVDRLIRAFSQMKQQNLDPTALVFVGGDPEGRIESYRELIDSLNISSDVFFLGPKKNPYKYMKRAKILVSPSFDEGLPGVVIEALSLGIPVVSTNSSEGVWEIMECDAHYDKNLNTVFETKFGYITPNCSDEEVNIIQLCNGITKCLKTEYNFLNDFNKERFEDSKVIKSLLSPYLEF